MPKRASGHVTMQDVVRACGFSKATVSIVLSKAPLSRHLAPSTRERIRETAQRLGYHPDAYARSLRRQRSQTVGVLAYDLSDPFCIPVVRGIQAGLHSAGYLSLLTDAQAQRRLFDNHLNMILERRAEAVIVIASWIFEESNLLAGIEKNHVPAVIVGRDMTDRKINSILVDNEAGGAMAMRHLYELGHRRIAVIRGPRKLFDTEPRWVGEQRLAAEVGIQLDPQLVFQLPDRIDPISSFEGGLDFSRQMLASGRPFTGVLAFGDLTALGVMRGLTEAGLRIPEDCSVVGFDDVLPAAVTTPGITTIRQPLKEMGELAAKWALQAIETRQQTAQRMPQLYKALPALVVRKSTGMISLSRTRPRLKKTSTSRSTKKLPQS